MPSAQQRWHPVQNCSQLTAPQRSGLRIAPSYLVHRFREPWDAVNREEGGREEREIKKIWKREERWERKGGREEQSTAVHNSMVALSSLSVAVGVFWCSKPHLVQLAQCHLHGTLLEDVTL